MRLLSLPFTLSAVAGLALAAPVRAQDPPPLASEAAEPPKDQPDVSSADELLGQMQREGSWSIVMMETEGRKITFQFGDLGKRVVELKWARDRNASVGEVSARLDEIYEEEGVGDFGKAAPPKGGVDAKRPGLSLSAQAFNEMHRAVANLNKGKFTYANNHLSLMESAASGLAGPEKEDYASAAKTLRRAQAILGGDSALRRMVLAAARGDFTEREALKGELRAYAKVLGIEFSRFVSAAGEIWAAYQGSESLPPGQGGDLAAALKELDAAEKRVQGRFKRGDYTAAFERVKRLARGLSRRERAVLAERLRRLAAMWNKAAANTLAFSLLASLSPDDAMRAQRDTLLDQARWKGRQGARAQNLAKTLLQDRS